MMRNNGTWNTTRSSSWLNLMPMRKFNYVFNKQQFLDTIRLRYGWSIRGLLVSCSYREGFNVQHSRSCKKGRFVTLHHNKAMLLSYLCKDVEFDPSLLTLNGEEQTMRKTAKTIYEIRLNICASGFWVSGQKTFFDVRFSIQMPEGTQNRLWNNVIPWTNMKRNATSTSE